MKCPLCQHAFDADRAQCASHCPLAASCRVICCPRCGYSFVEESQVVSFLGRLVRRWKTRREEAVR